MNSVLRSGLTAAWMGWIALNMVAKANAAKPTLKFSVCVINDAGVPSSTLRDAEKIAQYIFQSAGVSATFMDSSQSFPKGQLELARKDLCVATTPLLYVFLINYTMFDLPGNVMGVAPGDAQEPDRNSVYIFNQIVDKVAREQTYAKKPVLLGHAMAHEIGHILAHIHKHDPMGLMRADWQSEDYISMSQGRLIFASKQAAQIREEVTRRSSKQAVAEFAVNSHQESR